MGSPLSPVLADLVMETLLDTVIKRLDFCIVVIKKYVDDLLLIIPVGQIQTALSVFNSYHSSIQFTCEVESNGKLPFLDMTLIRQHDNTIRTEWYKKTIASERMLNFHSIHPLSQKINIMMNFIDRVNRLTTNLDVQSKRSIIFKQLTLNDYPRSLINRCLNRTNRLLNQACATKETNDDSSIVYRSIPHIPGLTKRITKILSTSHPMVKISTRNLNTISNLHSRIKDTVPTLYHHSVVYRVKYECNRHYIGMTKNLLKDRLAGHRSNVNALEQLITAGTTPNDTKMMDLKGKTALISHCIDHNHRFELNTAEILDHTHKISSLPLLEMIHIYNDSNCVNKRTDVEHLNSTYAGILHAIARQTQKLKSATVTQRQQLSSNA